MKYNRVISNNISKMSKLTPDEIRFLNENGYLILENVLDNNQLQKIKKRVDELFEIEGVRAGDVISSIRRSRLTGKRTILNRLRLFVDDKIAFKLVKWFVKYLRKKFPAFFYYITIVPEFYSAPKRNFRGELKLMFVNAAQQGEENVGRLCNLVNKGEEFDVFITHKKVLHAVEYLIGKDFKLSSLNYRAPAKGCWTQPMHQDWLWPVNANCCFASNTLWLLDDMTLDNGPTRVVPGSHRLEKRISTVMKNSQEAHPDEIYITAKAGSVIIINGHVWHGGTSNKSGDPRALIQSYFVHKAHHAQQYQQYLITPETRERLDERALNVLDVL